MVTNDLEEALSGQDLARLDDILGTKEKPKYLPSLKKLLSNLSSKAVNSVRRSPRYRRIMEKVPPSLKPILREAQYELTTLVQDGRRDMFTAVAIETTSICNRKCGYCPNSKPDLLAKRPQKEMDMGLYISIIDDLARIGFQGRVALQHYGEPLKDSQIDERVRIACEKLPLALITLYSNGDMLTPERLEALVEAGIGNILVTNHNPSGRMSSTLRRLNAYLDENPEMRAYCQVRNGIQTLSNRTGLVEIPEAKLRNIQYCVPPTHNAVIDVEGNAVICSNDYLGNVTLGNVQTDGIMNIWNSERYRTLRHELKRGIFTEEICKTCTG
ncbi:hypothetical protein COV16_04725 [Candidatus Woesearchaeota archaeon CG10_big_fil_rev_8_21_14_0_10_34_8]|nr:MAG: hypothetical protein COV16_04725 [Candidatus Woesearchaeota archaeon CG10_big_fil_rev_8_21_14_0_10_34_8]